MLALVCLAAGGCGSGSERATADGRGQIQDRFEKISLGAEASLKDLPAAEAGQLVAGYHSEVYEFSVDGDTAHWSLYFNAEGRDDSTWSDETVTVGGCVELTGSAFGVSAENVACPEAVIDERREFFDVEVDVVDE